MSVLGARPRLPVPVVSALLAMELRVFVPPCRDGIPPVPFGNAVLCRRAIFDHAGRYAQPFVGGALSGATVIRERTGGAPGRWGGGRLIPRPWRARDDTRDDTRTAYSRVFWAT